MANSYFDALIIVIYFVKNPEGDELPPTEQRGIEKEKYLLPHGRGN